MRLEIPPRPDDILNNGSPSKRAGEEIVKSWLRISTLVLSALLLVPVAQAEKDKELLNKVSAYISPGATDKEAVITVWMSNLNPVLGITLPFKFSVGADTLRLDSADVNGGRAAAFLMTTPVFKVENSTLLMNMIARTDTITRKMTPIAPGEGPLAWFYVRTDGKFPFDKVRMASVQLPPENVLLYVLDTYATINPAFEFFRKSPPTQSGKAGKKI